MPLTVRTASAAGLLMVINANTTWQAYNDWGGTSDWISNIDSTNPTTRRVLTPVTTHLLQAYAKGPAGREHPAHDNTKEFY